MIACVFQRPGEDWRSQPDGSVNKHLWICKPAPGGDEEAVSPLALNELAEFLREVSKNGEDLAPLMKKRNDRWSVRLRERY